MNIDSYICDFENLSEKKKSKKKNIYKDAMTRVIFTAVKNKTKQTQTQTQTQTQNTNKMVSKIAMTTLAAAAAAAAGVNSMPTENQENGMPTIYVPGYSITVTDYTGVTSDISTGQWVHLRCNCNNKFLSHKTNSGFQSKHGLPSSASIAQGVESADDSTKFMVLVLDGEQKKIQLMDEKGKCFKRYYTDAEY